MTRVYVANTSVFDNKQLFAAYYLVMPKVRQDKIDRCRFEKDKKLSLGVGSLLLYALADTGFITAGDFYGDLRKLLTDEYATAEDDNKKLYFINQPELNFNLSHSGSMVMCIVSDSEAGCDVEELRGSYADIADRFFFNKEKELIETSSDGKDVFFRLWTLKESFMKVTGLGFKLPLNTFSMEPDGSRAYVHMSPECERLLGEKSKADYRFYQFDHDPGYRFSCCVTNADEPELYAVDFKEFYNDYISKSVPQA